MITSSLGLPPCDLTPIGGELSIAVDTMLAAIRESILPELPSGPAREEAGLLLAVLKGLRTVSPGAAVADHRRRVRSFLTSFSRAYPGVCVAADGPRKSFARAIRHLVAAPEDRQSNPLRGRMGALVAESARPDLGNWP